MKAHEDEKRGIFAKENEKHLPVYKSKQLRASVEPFGLMQSRFNFRKPKVSQYYSQKQTADGPPPGKYTPKYIQVLPYAITNSSRIKSVPLMTDRKTESRVKLSNASAFSSMYDPASMIHNESRVPESAEDRSIANQSHLPNISKVDSTNRSHLFFGENPKGSINMKKMCGR